MAPTHVDNVVPSSADTVGERRKLQELIQEIESHLGNELSLQKNIARHWQVISAYTQLSVRSPAEQGEDSGLKAFADAHAHVLRFLSKVRNHPNLRVTFPLQAFSRAWSSARYELCTGLSPNGASVRVIQEDYEVYPGLLYHPADCPLFDPDGADVLTGVTVIRPRNTSCPYFCYTGWSQEPPTGLSQLDLNSEASDLTAIRELQGRAERNCTFFQTTWERSRAMRSRLSSQSRPSVSTSAPR
jgi:hypothetical protein